MGLVDAIGPTGLEVSTASQINAFITAAMQAIFTAAANFDSNSPDGQLIGISVQENIDLRELLVQINNSFDPDQAQGILLDQRCAINNIARIGGTYTVQPIDIVVNTTVSLQGLDTNYNNPNGTGFTVQDNSGNQFILGASTTITAGTHTLDFRAQAVGAVSVPIDTIINPVTILPGVVSVNNSSAALTVGVNQETDGALRIRRASSVANATSGNSNGLQGNLLALPGVTEAAVYQNRGNSPDINGTPGHTLWAIVAGGAAQQIATLLYQTISDGCGMRGNQSFTITTVSGSLFTAYWDNPTPESLYIRFSIQQTVPGFEFSTAAIKAYIAANLSYGIGQFAETSSITVVAIAAIAAQGGGGVPVLMQISNDNATWTDYLTTTTIANEFTVAVANITITIVSL